VSDKKNLSERIVSFLEKDLTKEPDERKRYRYKSLRSRMMRELDKFKPEQLKPMAGVLLPFIEKHPGSVTKSLFDKLNE